MDNIKQLYYKKGRRYIEYDKCVRTPDQLYYYDSDEFVPYDEQTMSWFEYRGLPAEGIWKVHRNGYTKIGEYDMTDFRIELDKYHDIVVKAVSMALDECEGKYISRSDIAREILNGIDKLNTNKLK